MSSVGGLLNFVGGSIGRVAGTGIATGLFMVAFGMSPAEAVVLIIEYPPEWLMSGWLRLTVLIIGMGLIWVSFSYNRWSKKQQVIDALSEDLSWAIHSLLNKTVSTEAELMIWEIEFEEWCKKVSRKLNDRAFFTRSDQIHFDRLGFIQPLNFIGAVTINMRAKAHHNKLVSHLNVKFDRMRDIINWTQMKRR